jgi:spore germination protein
MRNSATLSIVVCVLFSACVPVNTPQNQNGSSVSSSTAMSSAPQKTPVRVITWIPYWDQNSAAESMRAHADQIDLVSFFWYVFTEDGMIRPYMYAEEDWTLVQEAHSLGMRVHALIANLPDENEGGDWDNDRVERMLNDESLRESHIEDIITLIEQKGFDGIDIDYEALEGRNRATFSAFIEELGAELHAHGKTLGIALHPKTSETNTMEDNGSHAQDWPILAEHADYLYLMLFGEHYSGSDSGPLASLPWFTRVLEYAVEELHVPPTKIVAEIALSGQRWNRQGDRWRGANAEMTLRDAEALRQEQAAPLEWDSDSQSPSFSFVNNNTESVVWFENDGSLAEKLTLLRRMGITRIGLWRLGGETEEIWQRIH